MSDHGAATHWRHTQFDIVTLGIWFFFAFFIHWFDAELNSNCYSAARFLHGPSIPIAFVILLYLSTRRQEKLTTNAALPIGADRRAI